MSKLQRLSTRYRAGGAARGLTSGTDILGFSTIRSAEASATGHWGSLSTAKGCFLDRVLRLQRGFGPEECAQSTTVAVTHDGAYYEPAKGRVQPRPARSALSLRCGRAAEGTGSFGWGIPRSGCHPSAARAALKAGSDLHSWLKIRSWQSRIWTWTRRISRTTDKTNY